MTAVPPGAEVIFYDGVCAMCNSLVQFVLDRDRHDRFVYAALQSELSRDVLARHGRDPKDLDTLYVVIGLGTANERLLDKSSAAFHVCRQLPFPWWVLTALRVLPRFLTDWAYDRVARSRYRLFGKYDTCRVPSAKDRAKFLDPGTA